MDKYINQIFIKLSQNYKVNIIVITSYNKKYHKVSKLYKLVINSGKKKIKKKSLEFANKRSLVLEMMKWVKEKN